MTAQQSLLGPDRTLNPATGRPLTPDQEEALRLVRETPGGVTADEVGACLHERLTTRWQHPADQRCNFCASRGKQVLKSKGLRPLVIMRRASSRWEMRDGSTPPVVTVSAQLDGLPDWLAGEAA